MLEKVEFLKQNLKFKVKLLETDSETVMSIKSSFYYTNGQCLINLVHIYGYDNTTSSNFVIPVLQWHKIGLNNICSILGTAVKKDQHYGNFGRAIYFPESVICPINRCHLGIGSC